MTAGAKAKNIQGVVIDGRCRDLADHRNAGFPVSSWQTSGTYKACAQSMGLGGGLGVRSRT